MSDSVRAAIAKLLMVKAHEENPMLRGMETKEMAALLSVPITTINNALMDPLKVAAYGIYKLTPNRQRYVLWAYSLDVANKANGLPFDTSDSAGIDPKVQAAEVSKIVTACVNPDDHTAINDVRQALDGIIVKHGLSVDRGEVLGRAMALVDNYYEEHQDD